MIHGPHLKRPSELREREASRSSLKDMSREEAQAAGRCAACWAALQRGEPFNHLYHRVVDQRWS